MGLDMTLRAKRYIMNWDHTPKERRSKVSVIIAGEEIVKSDMTPSHIVFHVGDWRKANHIHQWFVDNVQDGVDNCGDYYVGRSQLEELRDLCKRILAKKDVLTRAEMEQFISDEGLETSEGFFFGEDEVGEWYYEDCESTIQIIEQALQMEDGDMVDFVYSSSW